MGGGATALMTHLPSLLSLPATHLQPLAVLPEQNPPSLHHLLPRLSLLLSYPICRFPPSAARHRHRQRRSSPPPATATATAIVSAFVTTTRLRQRCSSSTRAHLLGFCCPVRSDLRLRLGGLRPLRRIIPPYASGGGYGGWCSTPGKQRFRWFFWLSSLDLHGQASPDQLRTSFSSAVLHLPARLPFCAIATARQVCRSTARSVVRVCFVADYGAFELILCFNSYVCVMFSSCKFGSCFRAGLVLLRLLPFTGLFFCTREMFIRSIWITHLWLRILPNLGLRTRFWFSCSLRALSDMNESP